MSPTTHQVAEQRIAASFARYQSPRITATITVRRHEGGWRVEARNEGDHKPGREAFAAAEAYDLETAWSMLLSFFQTLAETPSG